MGRPKNENVWKHYRVFPDKSVQCQYCAKKYKISNVNRMNKHLKSCFNCPEHVKRDLLQNSGAGGNRAAASVRTPLNPVSENIPPSSLISSPSTSVSNIAPINILSQNTEQPSTSASCGVDDVAKQNILAEKMAKAIIISGAPFSMVEHPLWIDFFKELAPNFKLPTRKAVATSHLEKLYKDSKKEVTKELNKNNYLHMQCDGWSDVNNEGVINFIISNPDPFFVESVATEEHRHTSEYLKDVALNVMRTLGEEKFVTVIGDNAKNLQKSFELLKRDHPKLVVLNCAAHTLNLLALDAIKFESTKAFIEMATDVIKSFKRSQALNSILTKKIKDMKTGEKLKLPVKTRWGSYLKALSSLKNSKTVLQTLAIDENVRIPQETRASLLDDSFWQYTEELILLLDPICQPIFKIEANECNIHNLYMIFKDITSKLAFILPTIDLIDQDAKDTILAKVESRRNDCIKPIHLAAYLLDPRTQGGEMNSDEVIKAINFINDMGFNYEINEVMPNLAEYRAKEGFFRNDVVWSSAQEMSPLLWWKGICTTNKLSSIAVRILSSPCTSAATERSFSIQGNLHSAKRNRLTKDKAAKMTFISYNWNLLNKLSTSSTSSEDCFNEDLCSDAHTNESFEFVFCDEDDSQHDEF